MPEFHPPSGGVATGTAIVTQPQNREGNLREEIKEHSKFDLECQFDEFMEPQDELKVMLRKMHTFAIPLEKIQIIKMHVCHDQTTYTVG